MQDNRGNLEDLTNFKKLFLGAEAPEPGFEAAGWKPVMQNPDGTTTEPQGKSLAEMNEAMKAAGWSRAERRRYLSKARKEQA